MHRKIVFVKVESRVIEISESVYWSRRCYAISFLSGQPNDILSTYAFQKN